MAKCDNHPDRAVVLTGIIAGKFGNYCQEEVQASKRMAGGHAAEYDRARQREDFRSDMLQPKDPKTGGVNAEFVRMYPEESKEIFTEDQINQAKRQT